MEKDDMDMQKQPQQQAPQVSSLFTGASHEEKIVEPKDAFHLDQNSLKCKANCGFFGNPEWSGYCSLCFKTLNQKRIQETIDQQELERKSQLEQTSSQIQQAVSKLGFSNIVLSGYDTLTSLPHSIFNSARNSFNRAANITSSAAANLQQTSSSSSPTPSSSTSLFSFKLGSPNQSKQNTSSDKISVKSLTNQLQSSHLDAQSVHMRGSLSDQEFSYDVAWTDCLRLVNKFAREFLACERRGKKSLSELSDMVHDFYQNMKRRLETSLLYKNADNDTLELLLDNTERVLNEQIYQIISSRLINEDEEHIIAVQKRIKSLHWVTVEHLEININMEHPEVHDLLDKAICQMIGINSRASSIDKLECIVKCSKTIAEILNVARTGPVSADQFLPLLVFVVIQANPPMLPADIKYLNRFSNVTKLMSGETGYYFTNLCCALEFIEKASGASLNISQQDFDRYISGQAAPESDNKVNTYFCDALRIMCSNQASLLKLKARFEQRESKISYLFSQIEVISETIKAQIKEEDKFMKKILSSS